MINNDNSYTPKDDGKGMLETMKDIIRNKKKIKVHGNEFDFSGLKNIVFDNGDNNYAYGKIKINGTEIYVNVEIVKNINHSDNEEHKKFSYFGIYFNDTDFSKDVKINYNGKVFNLSLFHPHFHPSHQPEQRREESEEKVVGNESWH